MNSTMVKWAVAAVVVAGALAIGVETFRPGKTAKAHAFSAEVRANTALDLDPRAAIPLREAQPGDFDVTWDGENGGALKIMPGSSLRILAANWNEARWDDIVSWAHSSLTQLRESTATSVAARESRFAAILTSEGNLAVVEIGFHDEKRAQLRWQVESTALPVYGPVQVVTLGCIDQENASPQPCAIDFDTGRAVNIPSHVLHLPPEGLLDWLEQNGVDAVARMSDQGGGLTGVGLVFYTDPPGAWTSQSAVGLRDTMRRASHQPREPIPFQEGRYQSAHPFKTREGGMGMLQMRGVDRARQTVEFRYRMVQDGAADGIEPVAQEDPESLQLAQSQDWLMYFGRSLLVYANHHEDRLPLSFEEMKKYADSEQHYRWIVENVEYLGAGITTASSPSFLVAYDRTLLATGKGTYVLFLDSHVEFMEPKRLAEHGLPRSPGTLP
jgi:hypothetical protein